MVLNNAGLTLTSTFSANGFLIVVLFSYWEAN